MGADALWALSARDVAQRIRDGRASCVEVMRACLARCMAREPDVQAWEHLDAERAMERAEAADARLREKTEPGPLHGVPFAVKDIIDVAGMPTGMGSTIMAGNVPRASAECVVRLEGAGAIAVGKTVTTEFAYYTPGKTRNPWNTAHTPGGSSSGSAAAVACGMVPGALGTQTNGSVVRPAAFCGVVGYKPSFGAVSNSGTLDPWPTLDHTGVFARSVADVALLAGVIALPGLHIDADGVPGAAPRLVTLRSPVWDLAEPSQRESLEACSAKLRAAGASVVQRELPPAFDGAHAAVRTIMAYEAGIHFRVSRKARGSEMSAQLLALVDEGWGTGETEYRAALTLQHRLREEFARYVAPYDAVITPPAPGEAPATREQTGNPAFCSIWSLLGVPAITIPVGLGPGGLPLGLQLVGAYRGDAALLKTAAWCESQFGFRGLVDKEERQ